MLLTESILTGPGGTVLPKSPVWKLATPVLLIVAVLGSSAAMQGDTTADRVLGQPDFVHHGVNLIKAQGLSGPLAVAIDTTTTPNRLYVADTGNSRLLGWKDVTAFANGDPADLVIGQPDFLSGDCNRGASASASSLCSPIGMAVDDSGDLYVADQGNNRVLEYNQPFAACSSFPCVGGPASLVFGQGGSFTSNTANSGGVSAASLSGPWGVALDGSGNLYVGDSDNNRVLEYNTPLTTDTTADMVFGQSGSFTTNAANRGGYQGGSTARSMWFPQGVAVDQTGNLYVADQFNKRVLEYNTPLITGNTAANTVFGQGGSFTSNTCDFDTGFVNGASAIDLCEPSGVVLDGVGNLYVSDSGNNRLVEYNTPLTTDTTADTVFGQGGSFTSNTANQGGLTADSLNRPGILALDADGNLYVADSRNNRVLEFNSPLTTDTTADRELGQLDFVHNGPNLIDARGLDTPEAVAIDTSTTPNRVFVADTNNSRVLGWKDVTAFANGGPADLVIGQPDFVSNVNSVKSLNLCTLISASTLCNPLGLAVDKSGNLFVADTGNSRALEYDHPFASCGSFPCVGGPANLVFGQDGSFTSANNGTLFQPEGVAVDGGGNLYLADTGNNRVLEYNTPLTTDTTADMVFGQHGSFTSNISNDGGLSADSLGFPEAVAVDGGGNLYVSDSGNNRVLEYNTPLTTANTTANLVFGTGGSFTSSTSCSMVTASTLCDPNGLAADGSGNLYVMDAKNNRVLEYSGPVTTGNITADLVFGQGGSFTSHTANKGGLSADSLSTFDPFAVVVISGLAFDSGGNLYIADAFNNRVLEYDKPQAPAATPTPQATTSATIPPSLGFASSPVGDTVVKNLTIKNTGHAPFFLDGASSTNPAEFAVGASTCPPAGLASGATCTISIGFTPAALGARSATLKLSDNVGTRMQNVALSGTGTIDAAVLPSSFSIGNTMFGIKVIRSVAVYNKQPKPISLSSSMTGPNAADFQITGGTCTGTLGAGDECSIVVTFTPGALGPESATLVVTDSPDVGSPHNVPFSVAGTIPDTVVPATLAYGTVVRPKSRTLNATVTNKSPFTLSVSSGVSGTNAADFTVTGGTCGPNLGGNSSCTIAVTFKPTVAASESATLTVTVSSDPTSPHNVNLTGTGS